METKTEQIKIGNNVVPAMPTVLVGTRWEGKENFMTVAWCTRVNANPPKIGIAIHKSHLTEPAIRENGEFSVSVPGVDLTEVTDFCGVVSGASVDKSNIFTTFSGALENAPLIEECKMNIECKVTEVMDLETNTLFIGEIVGAWAKEEVMDGNKPSIEKVKPIILTMPDNRYWSLDNQVGNAWRDGIDYKNRRDS